jgi:hypothetical protein
MTPNHPNARFHFPKQNSACQLFNWTSIFYIIHSTDYCNLLCCSAKPPSHSSPSSQARRGSSQVARVALSLAEAKVAAATDEGHAALFAHAFSLCQQSPQTGGSFASHSNLRTSRTARRARPLSNRRPSFRPGTQLDSRDGRCDS